LAALPEGLGAAVSLSFGEGTRLNELSIALGIE
jgi:hypothetical protein